MMQSPSLCALVTVILWSLGGLTVKIFNVQGGPYLYIGLVLAALIALLGISFFIFGKLNLPTAKDLLSKQAAISSLGFGFYWVLIGKSVSLNSNASVPFCVQYVWPIFAALSFEIFFKIEGAGRITLRPLIGSLIGFGGVLIIGLGGSEAGITLESATFAVFSALAFGVYSAYSSTIEDKDLFKFLILSCLTGLLVLGSWAMFDGGGWQELTFQLLLVAFLLGSLVDGIGTLCWVKANQLVRQQKRQIYSITILPQFLPLLNALQLYLFFGETSIFSLNFLIGSIFIIIGSVIVRSVSLNSSKKAT